MGHQRSPLPYQRGLGRKYAQAGGDSAQRRHISYTNLPPQLSSTTTSIRHVQEDFRRGRGRLTATGPRFHRVSQVSGTCRRGSWEGLVDPFARAVCFVTYTEGTLRSLSGGRALLALDGSKHSGAVRPRGRKPLIWRHNRLYLAALGVSKSGSGYGMVPRKHQRQIRVNGALQACKT